jgi:hypothetical protein
MKAVKFYHPTRVPSVAKEQPAHRCLRRVYKAFEKKVDTKYHYCENQEEERAPITLPYLLDPFDEVFIVVFHAGLPINL